MKNKELLAGHAALLQPQFSKMTTENRLLRVVLMAYAKHHLDTPHIGWGKLEDALMCEIVNTIGDDEFIQWDERIKEESGMSDVED